MIEILLYITLGAFIGLFASCVADGFTTWRTRRRRSRMWNHLQCRIGNLPPSLPTRKDDV